MGDLVIAAKIKWGDPQIMNQELQSVYVDNLVKLSGWR